MISYETSCYSEDDDRSHSGYVNVSAPSMTATICDLHQGLQYRVGVAGSTSKGMGHFNHRDDIFASKFISTFHEINEKKMLKEKQENKEKTTSYKRINRQRKEKAPLQ